MNTKDVLTISKITRSLLSKLVKQGVIKATKLPNRTYEYDDEDVYRYIGRDGGKVNTIIRFEVFDAITHR